MDKIVPRYQFLLDATGTDFLRYPHTAIDWRARMIAIVGARGVGKTTLLLQHIKLRLPSKESLYVSADDFYFSDHRLLDFAESFHRHGGKYLFIDEIHKYAGWSREMKLIYDYLPGLQVVFTGSSVLDIFKGTDDLSRRALLYKMHGMSFREFLNLKYGLQLPAFTLERILDLEVNIPGVKFPLADFEEYLKNGYYPFAREGNYFERLLQTVQAALETDIPVFANLSVHTARKLKQLMTVLARSVPFKPNYSKLAEILGIDRQSLADYIQYMVRAGLLLQLNADTKGIRGLGKADKLYLGNTNLAYLFGCDHTDIGNVRETFFFNQVGVAGEVTASSKSDFVVNGKYTFEVGGRSKGRSQIKGLENAYVVKDDIEYGAGNTIPLWHFGFLY